MDNKKRVKTNRDLIINVFPGFELYIGKADYFCPAILIGSCPYDKNIPCRECSKKWLDDEYKGGAQ